MENLARKFLTEEEYLEYERKADTKSEYYRGELFAMAGAKASHNIILSNLMGIFYNKLRKRKFQQRKSFFRMWVIDTLCSKKKRFEKRIF